MSRSAPGFLPQVSFSILLALSLRERHGYEIMQQVEEDSEGKVKLGPGSLYGAIKQLDEDGLIEEVASMTPQDRRRYYKITKAGRERLGAEMRYFEATVSLAKERRILGSSINSQWT